MFAALLFVLAARGHNNSTSGTNNNSSREVIAFGFPAADSNDTSWRSWDWPSITTAVIVHKPPDDLVRTAHSHGSKVVQNIRLPRERAWNVSNTTARDAWISEVLDSASSLSLDGISLDIEYNVVEQRGAMTALVGAVAAAFRSRDPEAVVLFSVTMYPFANYSKASPAVFDYGAISEHCNFFFIMGYDTFGWPTTAHGGGRLPEITSGIRQFARLGVPLSKLVLGVGLFAFDFPCEGKPEPTVNGCRVAARCFAACPSAFAAWPRPSPCHADG